MFNSAIRRISVKTVTRLPGKQHYTPSLSCRCSNTALCDRAWSITISNTCNPSFGKHIKAFGRHLNVCHDITTRVIAQHQTTLTGQHRPRPNNTITLPSEIAFPQNRCHTAACVCCSQQGCSRDVMRCGVTVFLSDRFPGRAARGCCHIWRQRKIGPLCAAGVFAENTSQKKTARTDTCRTIHGNTVEIATVHQHL